ncbi:MAG: hypothetical protein CSA26_08680 [Desulfobacterales bacterium]|nr:MAG: hypothetical protein CSA26_08680 [Desulfobacterales bacterium]
MNIIFCEECGSRNIIEEDVLRNIEKSAIPCQVCNFLISTEHLIDYSKTGKLIDTSTYKLLVIDDDKAHLTLLQTTLEKEYTIHVATSGQEGLEKAISVIPDLILLDVSMPDMDGYTVCSRLKNNKRTRHIPIIFITGKTKGDDEYKGLSIGAIDYIFKPFNMMILNAKIASHLKFRTLRNELQQKIKKQENYIKVLKEEIVNDERYLLETENTAKQEDHPTKQTDLEKQHLIDIANTLNYYISIQDVTGRIIWMNKSMMEAFNVIFFKLQGKKCYHSYWERTTPCEGCICADTTLASPTAPVERFNTKLRQTLLQTRLALHDRKNNVVAVACTAQPLPSVGNGKSVDTATLPAIPIEKINDALSTLLISSDAMYNMYKHDKNLAQINQYINDASSTLRTWVKEFSNQT